MQRRSGITTAAALGSLWKSTSTRRLTQCPEMLYVWLLAALLIVAAALSSERGRGRLRLSLPAGEVEDLRAEQRREELPHLLQAVRRRVGGPEAEAAPGLSGQFQGQCVWGTQWWTLILKFLNIHNSATLSVFLALTRRSPPEIAPQLNSFLFGCDYKVHSGAAESVKVFSPYTRCKTTLNGTTSGSQLLLWMFFTPSLSGPWCDAHINRGNYSTRLTVIQLWSHTGAEQSRSLWGWKSIRRLPCEK